MAKQCRAVSTKGEQLIGHVGETADEFRARMKSQGHEIKEMTNADVDLTEEGLVLLGRIVPLLEALAKEVRVKEHHIQLDSAYDKAKVGGKADGSVQQQAQGSK